MSLSSTPNLTSATGTTGATGTAAAAATGAAASSSDIENQFMTLLVTQLKNQDPLNPMDNAQMTSQLAQMSELQGIENLNTTMSTLAASITGSQAMQAATLVGHSVMVPGNQMQLSSGEAVAGINLSQAADSVKVTISDASGTAIHSVDLGAQAQGVIPITWDGTTDAGTAAPDGNYTFTVTATANGQAVSTTALSVGAVVGVSSGPAGTTLNLGPLGNVSISQVQQYL